MKSTNTRIPYVRHRRKSSKQLLETTRNHETFCIPSRLGGTWELWQEAQEEDLARPNQRSWSWLANSNNIVLNISGLSSSGLANAYNCSSLQEQRYLKMCMNTCPFQVGQNCSVNQQQQQQQQPQRNLQAPPTPHPPSPANPKHRYILLTLCLRNTRRLACVKSTVWGVPRAIEKKSHLLPRNLTVCPTWWW